MKTPVTLPLILASSAFIGNHAAAEKQPKNIILVNCDDLGYGDLGCFGHPTIRTPHLDKMACEGQRWTSFYVTAAVSSPSRAGLLTGRLGVRTGMYGNERRVLFPDSPEGLPQSEKTIATLLKEGGYTTACVGKWHLGHQPESMPLSHGFDYFYGLPYSNDMSKKEQQRMGNNYYNTELPFYQQHEVIETEPDQTQLTQRLTAYAVSFITKEKDNPFFLYLAHPMPHIPLYASEKFEGKSLRGKYGDAVEEIDWSMGQLLQALQDNGLADKTLIIFTSDNGPWLPFRQDGGSAGLLKDGKGSSYEGGFRVPCIAWGEGIIPSVITDMASTLDLLPTFCEMAGVALPADRPYDGISLTGTLFHNQPGNRKDYPYFWGNKLYAYRMNNYKIHFVTRPAYGSGAPVVHPIPLLYDIEKDPGEQYDISSSNPAIVEELTRKAHAYLNTLEIARGLFDF